MSSSVASHIREHRALAITAAITFLYVAVRAHVQSITIDEADTFLVWASRTEPVQWTAASNNHVINSLLMRLSTAIFGVSHLAVRLPALVGRGSLPGGERRPLQRSPSRPYAATHPVRTAGAESHDPRLPGRGARLRHGERLPRLGSLLCSVPAHRDRWSWSKPHPLRVAFSCCVAMSFACNFAFAWVCLSVFVAGLVEARPFRLRPVAELCLPAAAVDAAAQRISGSDHAETAALVRHKVPLQDVRVCA